jgi:hypothetical membrane protein
LIIVRKRIPVLLLVPVLRAVRPACCPRVVRAGPVSTSQRTFLPVSIPRRSERRTADNETDLEEDVMTQGTTAGLSPTTPDATAAGTRRLLMCGVAAGPLFVAVATAQVLTRDGFDLGHQPISLLSVGDHGWIQISNFVVAGLLNIAFSLGVRRATPPSRSAAWASTMLMVYGVGLVAGGAFVPDPALGFPPGTPDEIPDEMTWHATLHAVGPALAFLALISASLVVARRFGLQGRQWWARYSAATGAVCLALSAWPDTGSAGVRLFLATVIGSAWVTALGVDILRRSRLT